MRIEELKKALSYKVEPVYLIEGEDAYFRELALKTIKKTCVSQAELNYNIFEGGYASSNQAAVVMALMQYPFMSDKRMIVIRNFTPTAKDLKGGELDKYLKNPADTSVLCIVNGSNNEALKKYENVTVIDCGKADVDVLTRYIQVTLKNENLIITSKTARLLIDYCRMDMTKISGETEKLAAYCHGLAEVTEADVQELVTRETDYQVYEMTDKVAQKKYDEAYAVLSDMQSKSNDNQRIFSALYAYFRRLFFCSVSQKSNAELAKYLGVKEYAVKKAVEQASKFTPKRLKIIVDMFTRYDADFKSGKITIDSALTLAVGKIME